MKQEWERLEIWIKNYNTVLLADLNTPAKDIEISELEHNLGVVLPTDFVECLKVHNGQKGRSEGLFDGYEFLSTRSIQMCWSTWNDLLDDGDFSAKVSKPSPCIQLGWWVKGWIPFATNGRGDYLCLDLSPSSTGNLGQVIKVFHDLPDRVLESVCFSAWFELFVNSKQ